MKTDVALMIPAQSKMIKPRIRMPFLLMLWTSKVCDMRYIASFPFLFTFSELPPFFPLPAEPSVRIKYVHSLTIELSTNNVHTKQKQTPNSLFLQLKYLERSRYLYIFTTNNSLITAMYCDEAVMILYHSLHPKPAIICCHAAVSA